VVDNIFEHGQTGAMPLQRGQAAVFRPTAIPVANECDMSRDSFAGMRGPCFFHGRRF
jgi:hypothetical protein